MSKTYSQIRIGAIISYIAIAVNIVAGLLYTPWMIEKIGSGNYGLYTLAHSLISLFMVDFGLSSAVARYLSNYRAKGNDSEVSRFLGIIYKLYIIIDFLIIIVFTIIFLFIDSLYKNLTPAELSSFKVVFLITAIFSVINFPFITLNGILTAYEQFIYLKFSELLYRIMVVTFTIIALLCGFGLYALVSVNVICGLLITLYKFIVIKKRTKIKVDFFGFDKKIFKSILEFSMWTTIVALSQRLIFNITPTIIGMRVPDATIAIAIFGIVTTLEGYTFTFATAINGMFLPKISNILVGGEDSNNLLKLNVKVGSFQFIVNGLILVGFVCMGKGFIELWVGEDFLSAYSCLILILIPGLFYNSMQTINTALVVKNLVKIQAIVNVVIGLINITTSYFMTKAYGVFGASLSIAIAYMIRVVLLLVLVNRKTDINIKGFIKGCYLKLVPPLLLSIIEGILIIKIIEFSGWLGLIVKAIIVCIVYFINMLFIGFGKEINMCRKRDKNEKSL